MDFLSSNKYINIFKKKRKQTSDNFRIRKNCESISIRAGTANTVGINER